MKYIIFLASVAMIVLTFAFPCFAYPVGSYNGSSEIVSGVKVEYSISFHFDGTIDYQIASLSNKDSDKKTYYKIVDGKIYISNNKDFDVKDGLVLASMKNLFTISDKDGSTEVTLTSVAGIIFTCAYGVLALVSLLTMFRKKKRR